ncbi:hypothetical protein QTP70_028306 [Hemibagrus guttatus]|uniref:ribonuclease H n=1 Tax=Hemibagrus guttatus TaxID=175788 RepID=A0AAE0RL86_9TELE|nr:hypothetical protein QTP70_028306 [Hemibagrus guttatus]
MVKFAYPLPLVPAVLEELHGAHIFSKLDLHSSYNLIRIRQVDEWKTAFITPSGHYEYQIMPYGLSNAPSVLQNFMNEIFQDMLHKFVIIYIDDILIYSHNLSKHIHHVQQPDGIQMDRTKVEARKNWPQLLTIKDLQRFKLNSLHPSPPFYTENKKPHLDTGCGRSHPEAETPCRLPEGKLVPLPTLR